MTEFDEIVVGKSSIPSLIIAVVLTAAITVIFFIYWSQKHKHHTKISWLIAGAAGFIVSALVLEQGVHYFCVISDNPVSRFINGNTAVYVLYGIIVAGVFEECGRFLILKYVMKRNRTLDNAVLYGIGHGGAEILAVVLPSLIIYLAVAVMFSGGNAENALHALNITEETAAAALPSVRAAAAFDLGTMAMNFIERLSALLLQIGLTVIIYYGVKNARRFCLPMAILLHMLMDLFPALYQRGLVPLWAVEVWAAVLSAVAVFIAVKLYAKMKELSQTDRAL